jgi:hypothetical protein
MEATPASNYVEKILELYRIQDASGVALVRAYIMRTDVQLEFGYDK